MMDNPNKTTKGDIAHSIAKSGIGAIPVIGSLASEIFGLIVTPPLEKRRAEWMNEVAQKLKELESLGQVDFDKLKDNEEFLDIVLQSTSYALKTSEKEKINSLKNALLNTAKGESPDKTKSQIFLTQIDKFTKWHIKILKLIDNPRDWFERAGKQPPSYMMGSISSMLKDAFPELKSQDELVDIIWKDLENVGFHKTGSVKSTMSGDGVLSERTTEFGKEFLEFISNE
tara:strand:- start:8513 stop:9196 length:684 start_codon:yes stop_codon:yes gene_type:complete